MECYLLTGKTHNYRLYGMLSIARQNIQHNYNVGSAIYSTNKNTIKTHVYKSNKSIYLKECKIQRFPPKSPYTTSVDYTWVLTVMLHLSIKNTHIF